MRHADGVGIGDDNGTEKIASILDPVAAGHLAIAIEAMDAGIGRDRRLRLPMRQDRGDAGAYEALAAWPEFALDHRAKADTDAGHIGDGIVRAGRAVKGQAEVAASRFAAVAARCHYSNHLSERALRELSEETAGCGFLRWMILRSDPKIEWMD